MLNLPIALHTGPLDPLKRKPADFSRLGGFVTGDGKEMKRGKPT